MAALMVDLRPTSVPVGSVRRPGCSLRNHGASPSSSPRLLSNADASSLRFSARSAEGASTSKGSSGCADFPGGGQVGLERLTGRPVSFPESLLCVAQDESNQALLGLVGSALSQVLGPFQSFQ